MQTQVLPYLRELKGLKDLKISLLTFEPNPNESWTVNQIENEKRKLADEGIEWKYLTYHKSPSVPATIYDILSGSYFIWKMLRHERIDVLHARVHIPALMGAIARRFSRQKPKLLFDIRGFFPEEYTDAGIWKEGGWIYKTVKYIEKWLLKESDAFVVLTEKAREILFPESKQTGIDKSGRPVEVIPCCVDLRRFENARFGSRDVIREKLNLANRKVIAYVGSFGGWYLTKESAEFLGAAKETFPKSFALILTQSPIQSIKPLIEQQGFTTGDFLITKVSHSDIPDYLNASDAAISFIKSCYSKQASSPTKNAEYLACGLPIVVNTGVGDTAETIIEDKTGIVIKELNRNSYLTALAELEKLMEDEDLDKRCRQSAKVRFSLEEIGGVKYRDLYRKLLF